MRIDEMKPGGFGHHPIWSNLVPVVLELDVIRLRREAGLAP